MATPRSVTPSELDKAAYGFFCKKNLICTTISTQLFNSRRGPAFLWFYVLCAGVQTFFCFIGFLVSKIIAGGGESSDPTAFSANSFMLVWVSLAIPSYLMMLLLVSRLNKRDLDAEEAVRQEKKKNRKSGGPPIMDRDGF